MAHSDLIVIWGGNPVNTQVNVMTHVARARKERGAKLVVVDPYRTGTAEQADMHLALRPGTDGALACAVMHVLFRDGYADCDYLRALHRRTGTSWRRICATRTPEWAARDHRPAGRRDRGLRPALRHDQALAIIRARLRLHALAQRRRQHARRVLPAGGDRRLAARGRRRALQPGRPVPLDKTLIEGLRPARPGDPRCSTSRGIGPILTGDREELGDGPPVTALLIQNTNPMMVCPELDKVHEGFAREDLFVCVHEQFMTETAAMADIVLPATMFLEHDDFYQAARPHPHPDRAQADRAARRVPRRTTT